MDGIIASNTCMLHAFRRQNVDTLCFSASPGETQSTWGPGQGSALQAALCLCFRALGASALLPGLAVPRQVHATERAICIRASLVLFLLQEYVEGTLVDQLRAHRPKGLPHGLVFSVIRQLLCALVHMHARKVMHRDLKVQNVLLTNSGAHEGWSLGQEVMQGPALCMRDPFWQLPWLESSVSSPGASRAHGCPPTHGPSLCSDSAINNTICNTCGSAGVVKLCDFGMASSLKPRGAKGMAPGDLTSYVITR